MKIAKQGWKFVLIGLAACAAGWAMGSRVPGGWALCALGAAFAAFCLFFFRDPDRPLPSDPGKIYSPGDGRVLSVVREGPGDIQTIRIFLSIFDVHVQRLPCSGKVDMVRYQPGSFALAMKPEAQANERNVVRIAVEGRSERLIVEQIAGFVARRIVCWVREGDRATAGERYGLIHFGSQAAVHLPASARPLVKPGDYVAGGITPIAEWIKAG